MNKLTKWRTRLKIKAKCGGCKRRMFRDMANHAHCKNGCDFNIQASRTEKGTISTASRKRVAVKE